MAKQGESSPTKRTELFLRESTQLDGSHRRWLSLKSFLPIFREKKTFHFLSVINPNFLCASYPLSVFCVRGRKGRNKVLPDPRKGARWKKRKRNSRKTWSQNVFFSLLHEKFVNHSVTRGRVKVKAFFLVERYFKGEDWLFGTLVYLREVRWIRNPKISQWRQAMNVFFIKKTRHDSPYSIENKKNPRQYPENFYWCLNVVEKKVDPLDFVIFLRIRNIRN